MSTVRVLILDRGISVATIVALQQGLASATVAAADTAGALARLSAATDPRIFAPHDSRPGEAQWKRETRGKRRP